MKLCTKYEVHIFTGFGYIVQGMPNIWGVMWPKPRPFDKFYLRMCTKFEVRNLAGFWDIVESTLKYSMGHVP